MTLFGVGLPYVQPTNLFEEFEMTSKAIGIAAASASLVALLVGCGGHRGAANAASPSSAASATPAAASATPTGSSSAPATVSRVVNKTGWYDGFAITVDKITATEQDSSSSSPSTSSSSSGLSSETSPIVGPSIKFDIDLSYQDMVNASHVPGQDKNGDPDPDRTGYLEVNGAVVKLDFDSPQVAPGAKAPGSATASIKVPKNMTSLDDVLDNVTLVYGQTDANQTKIPFAKGAAVSSLEPRGIPVGQIVGTSPSIELKNAYLWPSYQKGEKDRYELWVEILAQCTPGGSFCQDGGFIATGALSLTSPTGKTVVADARSEWDDELLRIGDNVDKWAVFVIDAPAKGDYTLHVRDDHNTIDISTVITL